MGVRKFATGAKPRWVMDRHPPLPRITRNLRQHPPLHLVVLVGRTGHDPVRGAPARGPKLFASRLVILVTSTSHSYRIEIVMIMTGMTRMTG
jgi:hypothetical protein